jgi:hypothetical protein
VSVSIREKEVDLKVVGDKKTRTTHDRSFDHWGIAVMSRVRLLKRPFVVLAAVLVSDLGVRLLMDFQMNRILAIESVLFAVAGVLLLWSARHDRRATKAVGRLDSWLAIFFALGSLRAGLWAAGLRVGLANLITLGTGVLIAMGYLSRRWMRRRSRAA